MSVPLSSKIPWELMNPILASQLNPIISSPLSSVSILEQIVLINGVTIIGHKLGRLMQGYFITDQNSSASIYRSQPMNNTILTLTSNAAVTVNIAVF